MSGPCSNPADDPGDHELDASDDECLEANVSRLQAIQDTLDDLTLGYRFFGKSSGANLVQTAINLKSEYSGTEVDDMRFRMSNRRPEFWTQNTVGHTPLLLSFAQLTGYDKHSGNVAWFASTPAPPSTRSQSQT